jgi:hypothetical protein
MWRDRNMEGCELLKAYPNIFRLLSPILYVK